MNNVELANAWDFFMEWSAAQHRELEPKAAGEMQTVSEMSSGNEQGQAGRDYEWDRALRPGESRPRWAAGWVRLHELDV
jgi:hypothetical protein